jgi:ribosomal protein L24E
MKSYKCTFCNKDINIGNYVYEHKITEIYFCSFECEGNFIINKYGRSFSSDEFDEDEREVYILTSEHFEG